MTGIIAYPPPIVSAEIVKNVQNTDGIVGGRAVDSRRARMTEV
jgi:hypothetical protein